MVQNSAGQSKFRERDCSDFCAKGDSPIFVNKKIGTVPGKHAFIGLYYKVAVSRHTSLGGRCCLLSFNGLNFSEKNQRRKYLDCLNNRGGRILKQQAATAPIFRAPCEQHGRRKWDCPLPAPAAKMGLSPSGIRTPTAKKNRNYTSKGV
jgi:hypothetical protein